MSTNDNTEALPPLPDLCSISKPLADFPEPVAYINMKTGQVKSLATLNREKPPGQWWPFNLQEQIWESRAALAQRQQVPEGCRVDLVSSRVCQRGVKSCTVDHALTAAPQAAQAQPQPLKRGITGICARSTCECESSGLGLECVWLRPIDAELERRTGEPHIDGWPLYSGLPPAQPQEPPRSAPLTDEQAIAIAAYYDVTSAMVRDIYNRAHGISTPEEQR